MLQIPTGLLQPMSAMDSSCPILLRRLRMPVALRLYGLSLVSYTLTQVRGCAMTSCSDDQALCSALSNRRYSCVIITTAAWSTRQLCDHQDSCLIKAATSRPSPAVPPPSALATFLILILRNAGGAVGGPPGRAGP